MFHSAIKVKDLVSKRLVLACGLTSLLIFVWCGSMWAAQAEADPSMPGSAKCTTWNSKRLIRFSKIGNKRIRTIPLVPFPMQPPTCSPSSTVCRSLKSSCSQTKKRMKDRRKVTPDPQIKAAFERKLAKAEEIAAEILARSSNATDALFAQVLVNGLRGDYAALIERRNGAGLKFLKSSRSIAERLLGIDPTYYDAYLAIGIENYLVGLRSAPMRCLLRMSGAQANKNEGIAKLKITAEKGRYLAPYARILLAIAAVRDKDSHTARELLSGLVQEFPQNRLYRSELARLQD